MSSPWLSIPLEDYEGHMGSADVQQLPALAELFKYVLGCYRPESVIVLGVAGGNGLEQIDSVTTKRVVGVDINQRYLDVVERRFGSLAGLELHCRDVANMDFSLPQAMLVHAALIFEHVGLGIALENTLSLVGARGRLSIVLQLPSDVEQDVSPTIYTAMQNLKDDLALIDPGDFHRLLQQKGFQLVEVRKRSVPSGKALWLGVFERETCK